MHKRVQQIFMPLAVIFILMACVCVQSTKLSVPLSPMKTFCFNQDLPRHTLMKLDIQSGGLQYRLQIMYLRELLENITASQPMTKSITTQKFGIYRICLTNEASRFNTLVFEFLTGVQAKDYASHIENSDYIGSIQNQAKIAELFIDQIKQENREGLEMMSQTQNIFNSYSIEYLFSAIFIVVTLALSYVQYVAVKNHMINRKYI